MVQTNPTEIPKKFIELTNDGKTYRQKNRGKLLSEVQKNWNKMKTNIHVFMVKAKVDDVLNYIAQFVKAHPMLSSVCVLVLAAVIIPASAFVLFIAANVALAFTGFIFIEVTILTISVTILCWVLFALVLTTFAILICGALTWITLDYFLQKMRNI